MTRRLTWPSAQFSGVQGNRGRDITRIWRKQHTRSKATDIPDQFASSHSAKRKLRAAKKILDRRSWMIADAIITRGGLKDCVACAMEGDLSAAEKAFFVSA